MEEDGRCLAVGMASKLHGHIGDPGKGSNKATKGEGSPRKEHFLLQGPKKQGAK